MKAEGVPVDAISPQNEVDTDQDGRMPACVWAQEHEIVFVSQHLGPALEQNKIPAKIWILDHNFNLWGRVMNELENPLVSRYADVGTILSLSSAIYIQKIVDNVIVDGNRNLLRLLGVAMLVILAVRIVLVGAWIASSFHP